MHLNVCLLSLMIFKIMLMTRMLALMKVYLYVEWRKWMPKNVIECWLKCKNVNTAPGSRLKLYALRLRMFRDTLILVFVNENCCLSKCFTELYFFFWLLVVSLAILIACPCCLFSSFMNIAYRSTKKCCVYVSNAL